MKLCKKILIVSTCISGLIFISCIILELLKKEVLDMNIANFIENWFTGIACSLIVVIVTTYLQFKSEEQKSITDFSVKIKALLYRLTSLNDVFDVPKEMEEILNSEYGNKELEVYIYNFEELVYKCYLISYEYSPFPKKKIDANQNLFNTLSSMLQIFTCEENDNNKYKIICELKRDIYIKSIEQNILILFDQKFLRYSKA